MANGTLFPGRDRYIAQRMMIPFGPFSPNANSALDPFRFWPEVIFRTCDALSRVVVVLPTYLSKEGIPLRYLRWPLDAAVFYFWQAGILGISTGCSSSSSELASLRVVPLVLLLERCWSDHNRMEVEDHRDRTRYVIWCTLRLEIVVCAKKLAVDMEWIICFFFFQVSKTTCHPGSTTILKKNPRTPLERSLMILWAINFRSFIQQFLVSSAASEIRVMHFPSLYALLSCGQHLIGWFLRIPPRNVRYFFAKTTPTPTTPECPQADVDVFVLATGFRRDHERVSKLYSTCVSFEPDWRRDKSVPPGSFDGAELHRNVHPEMCWTWSFESVSKRSLSRARKLQLSWGLIKRTFFWRRDRESIRRSLNFHLKLLIEEIHSPILCRSSTAFWRPLRWPPRSRWSLWSSSHRGPARAGQTPARPTVSSGTNPRHHRPEWWTVRS